jgi:rhomboid protease GluP
MSTITMDKKEELVMRLVHYFVTQENYTPIVVNGVKNEIWLENIDGPYRIIRINSNYIHNEEQYNFDLFKTKNIVSQIKKKTLSWKMNTLNIFLDLNKDVKVDDMGNIQSVIINNPGEIKKNKTIVTAFPDIKNKLIKDEKGIDLIINVTNDINEKTAKENKKFETTFSPKKIIVTNILITICVFIFLICLDNKTLFYSLANSRMYVQHGEWWRLITCAFLHGSIIHLLCNMYSLYIIGSQLEGFIGKAKFIFVYFVSALTGSLMSIVFSTSYSVGASGAIFGLMGSLLYFGYHYRLYLSSVIKTQIIPLIILNLLLGFVIPNVDNMAHIGGLIGGYLSTMAVGIPDKTSTQERINGFVVLTLYIFFLVFMGIYK